MLLHRFLEDSARKLPDKCALVFQRVRYSYSEINDAADRFAVALRALGIGRGERVAVFLDNRPESIMAVFGILKADAVFVILSSSMKPDKLSYILNNCEVGALVSDTGRIRANAASIRDCASLKAVIELSGSGAEAAGAGRCVLLRWEEIQSQPLDGARRPECANIDLDLASIIYTSGSTANPKGVMLTHLNMVSAATSITSYLENTQDDVILNVLPLSFDYGLYQALMAFRMGATLVLEKSFAYPYQVIRRMVEERVTGFPGVPTIFAILLEMDDLGRFDHSALRYVTNTAASLPVEHIKKLRTIFPRAGIYSMYGLTECKRVSYLPPAELARRPGSVGKAIPNSEVWIVDESGNRVGPGVVGELVVRGSNVMQGYWRDREATDAVLRPGPLPGERVLYTGDLFRMDEEGFLYFVGRKDDMIKTRGERVSPKEIENALYALQGIAEAAVIPVPDAVLGSAIKAFVVPSKGHAIGEKDIIKHCRRVLEDFAVPRTVEFRDSLPKNASGKIDKLTLKGTCR